MRVGISSILSLALFAGVMAMPATHADEKAEKGEKKKGSPVAFILKHAEELKLTDDQKAKLTELSKDKDAGSDKVKGILTEEQNAKLKELRSKGKKGEAK